jgi:hypothetical protein
MSHVLAQYTTTNSSSSSGSGVILVFGLFYIAILGFFLFAWSRIVKKAGYSPWYVLLALIPCVGIVMFFVFAFADWPVVQQARRNSAPPGYGYGGPGGYVPPTGPAPARPGPYPGVPGGSYGGPPSGYSGPAAPPPPPPVGPASWGTPPSARPPSDQPPSDGPPPPWGAPPSSS